jgi:hypothetical protein
VRFLLETARMMMTGTGKPGRIEIGIDGRPIAVINDRKFGFELGEVGYKVTRSGLFARKYQLFRDEELVIVAEQTPLLARYTISHAGKMWMLKAEGFTEKRFALFRDTEKVGRVAPTGLQLYKNIVIELPDELSRPAQVFLVWLVLWNWRD